MLVIPVQDHDMYMIHEQVHYMYMLFLEHQAEEKDMTCTCNESSSPLGATSRPDRIMHRSTKMSMTHRRAVAEEHVQSLLARMPGHLETESIIRTTCPVCGGGSDRETSFYVRQLSEHSVQYGCHRGTCVLGHGNRMHHLPQVGWRREPDQPRRLPKMTAETMMPEPEVWRWLEQKFKFRPDCRRVPAGPLVFPSRCPVGRVRGDILRWASPTWNDCPIPPNENGPKSKYYIREGHLDEPRISWVAPCRDKNKPWRDYWVVVTEDIISAQRVAAVTRMRAVSLNGTAGSKGGLSNLVVHELADHTTRLILALDPDVRSHELRCAQRYNALFVKICPLGLETDPKDHHTLGLYDRITRITDS